MNKVMICIGSNKNKELNLALCREKLCNIFPKITYSQTVISSPLGEQYKADFINQLATFETQENANTLESLFKKIEQEIGRQPQDKLIGEIIIDIDLLKWNNIIIRPNDMKRSYMKSLFLSLENRDNETDDNKISNE